MDAWYWYEALLGPLAINRADYGLGGLPSKTRIKRITDCDSAPGDFEQAIRLYIYIYILCLRCGVLLITTGRGEERSSPLRMLAV